VATTIAVIHRDAGQQTVDTWTGRAWENFANYHGMMLCLINGEIRSQARGNNGSISKLDKLYHQKQFELPWQRQQFAILCERLRGVAR